MASSVRILNSFLSIIKFHFSLMDITNYCIAYSQNIVNNYAHSNSYICISYKTNYLTKS